ncbi:MAG: pilus assembly protein [Microbacteriaceae bacterium]|nr:pilus assembly protein [Microbacteriaceae bacterium]
MGRLWRRSDSGSAAAEFVLVGALLTVLVLTVMQLALVLHIRNTLMDAAAEGARFAALADAEPGDGETRTRALIRVAIGDGYARHVTLTQGRHLGHPSIAISVRAPLPLIGLVGLDSGMEVIGHAAIEKLG